MRDLQHDNIVQYLGMAIDEENLNIFMECKGPFGLCILIVPDIPSGSIASLLRRFGKFSDGVIRVYTRQILTGLRYLHNHHIIHRGNIASTFHHSSSRHQRR